MNDNTEITERELYNYTPQQLNRMTITKRIILDQIELKQVDGLSKIYNNQEECSTHIVGYLQNRKIINIVVLALTQSGKTGTMSALIKNYLNHATTHIPIENIYIITGLSSKEWVNQTKHRLPGSIQERVYHRDRLSKDFVKDIKDKRNVLIIIDEMQVASKEKQTLNQIFENAGFYDIQTLLKNDVKIIEFTATPDGNIYDLINWGENARKIKMEPGEGYMSCFDLYDAKRVIQYQDLCCYDRKTQQIDENLAEKNITEIKEIIKKFDTPKYHIFRTPNGGGSDIVIYNFKKIFGNDMIYKKYDRESQIEDINDILEKEPENHIFIFIKEKLRCAKTLNKKYLGVLYERYTKRPGDSVIVQGLIGRGTGYDDNGQSVFFTNKESIENYRKLWVSDFNDKSVKWRSRTTKRKGQRLSSTGTYNNPALIDGMSISSESSMDEEPVIQICKTHEEAMEYFEKRVKKIPKFKKCRGPQKRIANKEGFYEAWLPDGTKPRTVKEINDNKGLWLQGQKYPFRYYPCYENLNDKNTLQFWLIYLP